MIWGKQSDEMNTPKRISDLTLRNQADAAGKTMAAQTSGILVFGGTGGTGLEIVKILSTRGGSVTVFVRETSDRSALEPLGVDQLDLSGPGVMRESGQLVSFLH